MKCQQNLRYYLNFCHKYNHDPKQTESLPEFINTLRDKKQSKQQQKQAFDSIIIYYKLFNIYPAWPNKTGDNEVKEQIVSYGQNKSINTGRWDLVYNQLSDEIKVRHYSPKTLKAYSKWVIQFQKFVENKALEELSPEDVKQFLTYLAVDLNVSASAQNQAFNGLLFFFRNILKKEFGKIDGVVRAKRKPYIPVVLSRREVDLITGKLRYPYNLIVKLLYGCGLRLSECMTIIINNLNFDNHILTIHDDKGLKDRTLPLPEILLPDLQQQIDYVKKLHLKDIEADYSGVFMFNAVERKYQNAGRELPWQWLFPAKEKNSGVLICILPMYKKQSNLLSTGLNLQNVQQLIHSGIVLQVIYYRLIMISVLFRSFWDTVISEQLWLIRIL
jgi:site-specific recombinase XerD